MRHPHLVFEPPHLGEIEQMPPAVVRVSCVLRIALQMREMAPNPLYDRLIGKHDTRQSARHSQPTQLTAADTELFIPRR